MLELKQITKDYLSGENTVHALQGIDLCFRSNEFVSILGQSGCGKTTMLNIIGGLDQYTSGDLVINGLSTKKYKDRDWDTYRNHSIGFVFQSYNLIPHQSVLQNVELALTLSGVSKAERRQRAKEALEQVGLGNQFYKKPSEMSGGQMQRVAIARALINNPDIILADEPTGALDTETSVQVMEILKKISQDRLIIMVTHNPELAEKYSSRIIRMLDGKITDDSNPLTEDEIQEAREKDAAALSSERKIKKPSMSFATAFSLSLKNLFTKKGRTFLTAFAGSIGIIGISLILSISEGLTTYIDMVQENALSSYPLMIESQNVDLSSVMMTFMNVQSKTNEHDTDAIYKKSALYSIIEAMNNIDINENDLDTFSTYLEEARSNEEDPLHDAINGIQYSYDITPQILTRNTDDQIIASDTLKLMRELMGEYMSASMSQLSESDTGSNGSSMSAQSISGFNNPAMNRRTSSMWQELLPGNNGEPINNLIQNQYDLIYGSWPDEYNEVLLILDENNELNDLTLYALGLESKETMENIMKASFEGTELINDNKSWSYEELSDCEYKLILNADCYSYDESTGTYTDLRDTDTGLQYLYDNALDLKVTGIIRPKPDTETTMLYGTIGYTSLLTDYMIEKSGSSELIQKQLDNEATDILTGLPFRENAASLSDEEKETAFREYASSMDEAGQAALFIKIMSIPDEAELAASIDQAITQSTPEQIQAALLAAMEQQMSMSEEEVQAYLSQMDQSQLMQSYQLLVTEQMKQKFAAEAQQKLGSMSTKELSTSLKSALELFTTEQCASYYDTLMDFSDSTYDANLTLLGYVDSRKPTAINLYASTFSNKDIIEDAIKEYNQDKDEMEQIKYTDYVGIIMSSVTSIINAITYILIAFVAISLIVSSIMIGVITLISVQERTKEIGILRAIGASKKDVSAMFNAETVIIGFCAGVLGNFVTYLLCFPINAVIHKLTNIQSLNAHLPLAAAVILVAISVILTLISGLIPSRSAAKKDPVVALRTE